MRLFLALDIDDPICERITRFVEGVQGIRARGALGQRQESMHITLKFIGEQTLRPAVEPRSSSRYGPSTRARRRFNSAGYGFFPTAKSARVFWSRHGGRTAAGGAGVGDR